jgi:intergrase/recombinase
LRKAIPKDKVGIDLHIPEPEEIVQSQQRLSKAPEKYQALWNLCLDGGIRLVEGIGILEEFSEQRFTAVNGFYRYEVGAFRESKQAYYAYFLPSTLAIVREAAGVKIKGRRASSYYSKRGLVSPKYLRKFAFDIMTSEILNIPESVADFVEGRVPKTIGARHYMKLRRQADSFYPRYAEYLATLRSKAGLN